MLREKHTTDHEASASSSPVDEGREHKQKRHSLEGRLRILHNEHGHGHPVALEVELELARLLYSMDELDASREAFAEVLAYQSVIHTDQGIQTALVARDLFRLLCDQDDRSAMAEIYYRYLSWIPMRDPATLNGDLRGILREVEVLLARTT